MGRSTSATRVYVSADTKGYERGMDRGVKKNKEFGRSAELMGKSFGNVSGRLKGVLVGITGVAGAGALIKDSVSQTQQLAKSTAGLARLTGQSTQEASRWVEVAKVRNVEGKALNMGFISLAKNMKAATDGGEAQQKMFKRLGVSQKVLESGKSGEVLAEVADAFAKMPAGAEKAATAQRLFGRQAQTLLPLLDSGSASLREQLALSDKYGTTLSENQVKKALEAAAAQRELTMAMDGIKVSVGTAVLPYVTKGAGAIAGFVGEVRDGTGAGGEFRDVVEEIAEGVEPTAEALGGAAVAVGKFTKRHPELLKVAGGVLAIGVAVKALKFASAVTGMTDLVKVGRKAGPLLTRVLGRAGTQGGTTLAANAATSAAGGIGPQMNRRTTKFTTVGKNVGGKMGTAAGSSASSATATAASTGIATSAAKGGKLYKGFRAAGKLAGGAFGVGAALIIADEIDKALGNAFSERNLPKSARSPANKGLLGNLEDLVKRDLTPWRNGGVTDRVRAILSPGELGIEPDGNMFTVPGRPVAADTVPMLLKPKTEIFTWSGQSMLAAGASRRQALHSQAPHFRTGGTVVGATYYGLGEAGTGTRGYRGDSLPGKMAYAELGQNGAIGNALGGLPYKHPLTIGYKGKQVVARKLDVGRGGADINGKPRAIDLWRDTARAIGFPGYGLVRISSGAGGKRDAGDRSFVKVTPARTTHPLLGNMLDPLVDDALMAGITAGREGASRRPLLTSVLEGIVPEAEDRPTRERMTIPGRPGIGEAGVKATGPLAGRIARMIQTGDAISAKKMAYQYGGYGNPSYDCSGMVSAILNAGGVLDGRLDTIGLMGWGKPGKGRNVTVGVRGGAGRTGHTMMQVGNRFYESGGGHGPARVSGWNGTFTTWRHPAFGRGGIVGPNGQRMLPPSAEGMAHLRHESKRRGVPVAALLDPESRVFVGWGMRPGGSVPEDDPRHIPFTMGNRRVGEGFDFMRWLRGYQRATKAKTPLRALVAALGARGLGTENADRATRVLSRRVAGSSFKRLLGSEALAQLQIRRMAKKGFTGPERIRTRRLRGALTLLQDEQGRRIGRTLGGNDRVQDRIADRDDRLGDELTLAGVDPDSVQGLEAQRAGDTSALGQLQGRRGKLSAALRRAKKTGNKAAVAAVKEEIKETDRQILSLKASIVDLDRSIQEAKPTATDFANRDLALAQLTETAEDDLAAMRSLEQIAQQQLDAALQTADPRDDIEAANALHGVRESIKGLVGAMEQNASELKALRESIDRQNDHASSVAALGWSSALKFMADVLAGEVGAAYGQRAMTPGTGALARV
jgi:hypothetical protein